MKKIRHILTVLLMFSAVLSVSAKDVFYNVLDFGAKGDGKTNCTKAINAAIAAAAKNGGGTVFFPAGNYLSYSIHLQSHVALHLNMGATIVAAEPSADLATGYDAPEPTAGPAGTDQFEDFGHSHWHNSLIWGEGHTDIAITGPGKIYGKGLSRGRDRRDLLPAERRLPKERQPDVSLPAAARATIAALP